MMFQIIGGWLGGIRRRILRARPIPSATLSQLVTTVARLVAEDPPDAALLAHKHQASIRGHTPSAALSTSNPTALIKKLV